MKIFVGLFIAGLLVSESYGLTRSIFRKCQQSGITFPTCEDGERLGYFRNTSNEVISGNFGKFCFLHGYFRVLWDHQGPSGAFFNFGNHEFDLSFYALEPSAKSAY